MSTGQNINENQYTPLEVPEVVPGVAPVDFPEISDFLKSMKIKGSLFGFQKEDVYEKMQQLNGLYQTRVQQMREQNRGQLKQMKKQQQEELEDIRCKMEREKEEAKAQFDQELAEAKTQLDKELAEAKAQFEQELAQSRAQMQQELEQAKAQAVLDAKAQSKEEVDKCHRELGLIREEMDRLIDRLMLLKNKVNTAAGEK